MAPHKNDSDYERKTKENKQQRKWIDKTEWKKEKRLGSSLEFREDLYAHSYVSSFHSAYLAQVVFFNQWQSEKDKSEDALEQARQEVMNVQNYQDSAAEDERAFNRSLLAYY